MDNLGQTSRRVLLLSLAGMILPLVTFPARFGLDLARSPLLNLAFEFVFYGLVIYLVHRRINLPRLVVGALVCLSCRLALGLIFGTLIAALYSMDLTVCIRLGLFGYLPSVIVQAVVVPFAVLPLPRRFTEKAADMTSESAPTPTRSAATPAESRKATPRPRPDAVVNSVAVSKGRGVVTESTALAMDRYPAKIEEPYRRPRRPRTTNEWVTSGFDKAVTYIGEHGAVDLAAVVDGEGLLLGSFTRNEADAESWAPLAPLFLENSGEALRRTRMSDPHRVDMHLDGKRVVVARSEGCYLLVLSDRHEDDLLNIRINQGLEMINRFVAERYGDKLNSNAESIHVSSAQ